MRKLRQFILRRKRLVLAALAITLTFIVGAWWWNQPVALDFAHKECEISYGDEIGLWRGTSDDEWNREGMVYVARSFSLSQEVEGSYRPNAYYRSPHTIRSSGEGACSEKVDDYIDTESDYYSWNGARAEAIRFGVPFEVQDNPDLNVSAFAGGVGVQPQSTKETEDSTKELPFAWAFEGGRAVIEYEDNQLLAWCVNDPECEFERNSKEEHGSSPSFYYGSDCASEGATCGDGRYDTDDINFSKDDNSYVEPFHLRMSAISEYPPSTAAETVLVFAYSVTPILSMSASLSARELQAQDEVQLTIRASSLGPRLSEGSISIDVDDQPLSSGNTRHELDEDALDKLHDGEIVRSYSLVVTEGASPGTCYAVPVAVESLSVEGDSARIEEALSYCIESAPKVYTYSIATRGDTISDLSDFARQAAETLADSRGWVRGGVQFERVSSGGDFTLWLAAPDQLTSFSSLCSAEYSCRVGRDVIVNDLRWREATKPWNEAGGSIRDYRHMVVNHEVGHLIGFGHYDCPGPGRPAPVMQQQSINLQGCKFNPWPLQFEIDAVLNL